MVVPLQEHRFEKGRRYERPTDYSALGSHLDPLSFKICEFLHVFFLFLHGFSS